jgi:hypothetical protein
MKVILEKYFETIRKLFLEIGIKSITMDDICNELGISKKTYYKEYTDKSELVIEVFHFKSVCKQEGLELWHKEKAKVWHNY